MQEKSENFNSLRPILFELCKKNYRGGVKLTPPPAGIGLSILFDRIFPEINDFPYRNTSLELDPTLIATLHTFLHRNVFS